MTAPGVTALVVSAGWIIAVVVVVAAVVCAVYWSRDAKQRRRLARLKGEQ